MANDIIKFIVTELVNQKCYSSFLQINLILPSYESFDDLEIVKKDYIIQQNIFKFSGKQITDSYDLILGILPIGLNPTISLDQYKIPINYDVILNSLLHLNSGGLGIYLVEPSFFWSTRGKVIQSILKKNNINTHFCIQIPSRGIIDTKIDLYLIGLSHNAINKLFIADIDSSDYVNPVIGNYIRQIDSKTLIKGTFVDINNFISIDTENYQRKKEIILENYKDIDFRKLGEITDKIEVLKDTNQIGNPNKYVFISKQGNVPLHVGNKNLKNCYALTINKSVASYQYMYIFFESSLGKTILNSIKLGTTVPYIRKNDLLSISIPIPKLEKQKEIVAVHDQLKNLKDSISTIENELSLNINNSLFIRDRIKATIDQIKLASSPERILFLIREGESQKVEFKETFSLNIATRQKDRVMELSALKTIVGFLNTNGGFLLIGVSDTGEINGINNEITMCFDSNDKYLLYIKDKIKTKIGMEYFNYINYSIICINDKKILFFDIQPSTIPCCYETNDFYIRLNPATEKISGKQLIDYVIKRFGDT